MEVPGGHNNKFFVCLYEALGTAMLILSLNLSKGDAIAIGLALFSAIVVFGPVSGAHFNPATTTSVFFKEGLEKAGKNCVFYLLIVFSQIVGGIVGVLIAYGCQHKNDENQLEPGIAFLCPPTTMAFKNEDDKYECRPMSGTAAFNMILAESMATFLYVSVILSVKYFHRGPDVLKAFAIGGCLLGMIYMI